MKWILDHLQILIAVGAAFAYWLNQRKQANTDEDGEAPEQRREFTKPAQQGDVEEAERTRRIQEEIRRKIAERASGGPIAVPPPALEPPPIFQRDTMAPRPVASPLPTREYAPAREAREERVEREIRREQEEEVHRYSAAETAALERQRELDEQMSVLAEAKRVAQRKVEAIAAAQQTAAARAMPPREDLLADLRGARNLRRAMVLREVLGPPVALR